jgi:hypothetical protein
MKKKIIIAIVLFLLFSLAFGLIYLNNVYLPVKVKGRLANLLATSLNYNAEIGKLSYSLIKGLIIQDIVIYDKVKDKENTLLTVKEASFHILFLPLIKERKIIIPIMHIDSPYLHIRYQQDGNLNFSKISLPKPSQQAKPKVKFSFLIYKINIFNGSGVFEDESLTPKFSKTIQDFNIGLTLSPLAKISFLMGAKLLTDKEAITKLSCKGEYNVISRELNSKVNLANLVIPEFNPYFTSLPLSITSGTIENSDLDLKFKDNIIDLKGNISIKGLTLKKGNLTLTADMNITPELSYALDKKTWDYQANLQFLQANLNGLQYIEKVSNISGDMGLMNNKLWTDNLKLQALDSVFMLKGRLEDFLNPFLKANLTAEELNLEKLVSILPFKPEGLNLSGTSKADINIEGYLKKLPLDTKASLKLKDAKLQTTLLKEPINNVKGKVDFTSDTIDWLNLSFNYLDTDYTTTGNLTNFKAPQINFGLSSKDLDLKSDIKMKDNLIRINTCAGKYVDSGFDIKGDIDTQDKTNPGLDLSAKLNLKPSDVLVFLPPTLVENLKKIKLDGILNIQGSLIGKTRDYKNWNTSANITSHTFSIYNLKLSELSFNIEQKNGLLDITPFAASGYSGIIILNFSADLKPGVPTYNLKLNGSGIDLAKLKLDTDAKDKDIAGILNISADLNGNFEDLSALKGTGLFSIKEGKLWQLNLLKGLGELFLLPDYEKIIFKEALFDCAVADKSISTENLRLISDQLNLDCKGKLGFDGTLDFTVYTTVNKNLIRDSADLRKFTTAILEGLSSVLTIKVSGTIQNPKYKIIPMPLDLIKNIKDFFLSR